MKVNKGSEYPVRYTTMVNILFFATITLLGVGIDGVLGYWLMGASKSSRLAVAMTSISIFKAMS